MQQLILIFHVLIAVSLIVLVLLQHGKGADIGAAFGSGASQTVFGSQGSGSFLVRITAVLAALFFATSLTLSYMATKQYKQVQQQQPMELQLPSSISEPKQNNPSNPVDTKQIPAPVGEN